MPISTNSCSLSPATATGCLPKRRITVPQDGDRDGAATIA
jgi:hypothetical protein